MDGTGTLSLTIHRSPIGTLTLQGPKTGLDHLELLAAPDLVRDWKLNETDGTLAVQFRRHVEGPATLYFRWYTDTKGASSFTGRVPEFSVLGVQREKGYLAIRRRTNVSVDETKRHENLEPMPLASLPDQFRSPDVMKALLSYRYLEHPYDLELKVTRHRDAEVVTTVVDALTAKTLVARDGTCLTQLDCRLRSRTRNPLELSLEPCGDGASVTDILLDDAPASLSHRPDGAIEVSLASLPTAAADEAHRLVVVIRHATRPLGFSGNLSLALPKLGATISKSTWYWSVPDTHRCFGFDGNFNQLHACGASPPDGLPSSGYRGHRIERSLLPAGKILQAGCSYVCTWVEWLPWVLFFAGGLFFVHAALVTLLGCPQTKTCLPALIVLVVVLVLFADHLTAYLPAAGLGIWLYLTILALYVAYVLGCRLRDWLRRRPAPPMTAIETNIARVAPDVEGGGADA